MMRKLHPTRCRLEKSRKVPGRGIASAKVLGQEKNLTYLKAIIVARLRKRWIKSEK